MRLTEQYSITLPRSMARAIEKKVASGAYASVSEVVREGIRSLVDDRDAHLERWMRTEIVARHKRYLANPTDVIPLEKVFARFEKKPKKARLKVKTRR